MITDLSITAIHTVFEGESNPGHIHNAGRHSDCFVYYEKGEADYLFDGYSFHAQEKSVFFLAKGSVYDIVVQKKSKYICIDFDFSRTQEILRSQLFHDITPTSCHEFSKFFHTWTQKSPWRTPRAHSILYRIYEEAVRSENKEYTKSNGLFLDITAYILTHYTDPALSVSGIAAHAGISELYLRRLFKANGSPSPIGYIHLVRLEKAKNMLLSSNYSISEIALAVGYPDPYYFSRLFRKKTGISPSEYKKRQE